MLSDQNSVYAGIVAVAIRKLRGVLIWRPRIEPEKPVAGCMHATHSTIMTELNTAGTLPAADLPELKKG